MTPFIHPPKAKRSIVREWAIGAVSVVVTLAGVYVAIVWMVN